MTQGYLAGFGPAPDPEPRVNRSGLGYWFLTLSGGALVAPCAYCGMLVHRHDELHVRLPLHLGGFCQDAATGEVLGSTCANIDHRQPVVRGGLDELANYALACWRCNGAKAAKTEQEYRAVLRDRADARWRSPSLFPEED